MAQEKPNKTDLEMANRRKQVANLYDGDAGLLSQYERNIPSGAGQKFSEKTVAEIISRVGGVNQNKKEIRDLANFAYATDPMFANIIDYLSNMFLWRYYYFPVKIKQTANEADYGDMYDLMTQVVDGLAIEVSAPTILAKLFREGSVFLYAVKDNSSKTISTLVLNSAYCTPILISQYGTGVYNFDLKYFDDLGLRGEELQEVLEIFPSEITNAYYDWKRKSGPQKKTIDGRFSTYLTLNDYGFPSQLAVLKGLFDYDQYRKNEVERSSARLDTIITHKIPSYENRLLFELPEVKSLHRSMTRGLATNKRVRLLTTFGDVEIHQLQKDYESSSETLEKAQAAIIRSAGLNANQFLGENVESLKVALQKDQAAVWRFVQQLVNFYNLTINNLYNFKGYEIQLTMLPITHYNLKEMMEIHRRNAEYGIGRLEAVAASGTKQGHIEHKSKLEEFLKLDEVLKPLASSHTQSSKEKEKQKTKDSPEGSEDQNGEKEIEEKEIEEEEKTDKDDMG